MANPSTPNSQRKIDPGLPDVLNMWKKDVMLSMNCHAIATVQSFDAARQTVEATINYKKTQFQKNQGGDYVPVLLDYPVLVDCPAIILGGGNFNLTFPIQQGDECVILFNDRSIDNWFQTGQVGELSSSRLHSFSDGLALVGVRSLAKSIADYDTTRAVLRNGDTMVAISETLVKISNATTTLKTVLNNLITEIQAIQTSNAVVGAPCTIGAASITALNGIKTQVEGLLE